MVILLAVPGRGLFRLTVWFGGYDFPIQLNQTQPGRWETSGQRLSTSSSRPRFHLFGVSRAGAQEGRPALQPGAGELGRRGRAADARRRRASGLRAGVRGPPSWPFRAAAGRGRGAPAPRASPSPHPPPASGRLALPGPSPPDHHLPPQLSHLFRSAQRHRRPCGRRRQLSGPPWCSDDAPGEPLRPLPRLGSRRPTPLPGPRPRQVNAVREGRRKEGASAREPEAAWARRAGAPPRGQVRRGSHSDPRGWVSATRERAEPGTWASSFRPRLPAPRGLEAGRRRLVAL